MDLWIYSEAPCEEVEIIEGKSSNDRMGMKKKKLPSLIKSAMASFSPRRLKYSLPKEVGIVMFWHSAHLGWCHGIYLRNLFRILVKLRIYYLV